MKLQSYLSIAVLFFIVGCAVPTKTTAPTKTTSTTSKPEESTPIAVSTTTVETPEPEESTGTIDTYAIFYIAHPQGSPKTILAALRKYPQLKLTIAFPPKYFSTPENKTLINEFKTLVSSGQIEIAMSLDNEPILPLLGDLHLAGSNVPSWHVDYRWSDDIAAHVAQGSGRYQKLWGTLPAGFIPPYLALSEDVVSTLKRFRLDWVLGKPTATESVTLYDSVIVVNPKEINALNDWYEGSPEWADQQVSQIVQNLFAVIDARAWTDLKAEPAILDRLGFYFSKSDVPARTAKVWVDELLQKNIVKDATFVEKADLSA